MTNTEPSLRTGTVIIHPDHGKGVIVCQYEEEGWDMVEVHWQSLNIIMEHRTISLRKQLTEAREPATTTNLWAMLAEEN